MLAVQKSAQWLADHFEEVPLYLFGFSTDPGGSSIYPALWSAQLAARAEGIGSSLTQALAFHNDETLEILGVPEGRGLVHGRRPLLRLPDGAVGRRLAPARPRGLVPQPVGRARRLRRRRTALARGFALRFRQVAVLQVAGDDAPLLHAIPGGACGRVPSTERHPEVDGGGTRRGPGRSPAERPLPRSIVTEIWAEASSGRRPGRGTTTTWGWRGDEPPFHTPVVVLRNTGDPTWCSARPPSCSAICQRLKKPRVAAER